MWGQVHGGERKVKGNGDRRDGTAELANWARAVVVIRSIGAHTVFEIVLGKRGKRAGLRTDDGDPV